MRNIVDAAEIQSQNNDVILFIFSCLKIRYKEMKFVNLIMQNETERNTLRM